MADQGDWHFAIDIHPDQWCFPAGRSWIAGWLQSRSGRAVADVRAWIDDRPFLGLCGLPRPEIERQQLGRDGPPHLGFSFLLEPHVGARWLRVEACDQSGQWEEVHRREIKVAPEAAPLPAAAPLGKEISALLILLLRARQANPGAPWSKLAGETLAAHRAEPLNTLPNPPFYGALEEPTSTGRTKYGRLTVTGWLAHRERTITRLTAFTDPLQPVPLLYGLPRRDVSGLFAGLKDAEHAQFTGQVDVPFGLPQPISLRIFAELDDGHRELVFNHRFRPQVVAGTEPSLPPLSPATFLRAMGALQAAARRQQVRLRSWITLTATLRGAWAAYRAGALVRQPRHFRRFVATLAALPRRPLHVVLVSHNLNLEGAPLFASEYACHLVAQPGWRVRVVSPQDGPLRQIYENAGIPVDIVDPRPLLSARTPRKFAAEVAAFAAAQDWSQADLVVANTMVAFWAVHVAHRLRKPSLLYIHESATVRRVFEAMLVGPVEKAFGLADRVVFIAASTLTVHARLERNDNFVLVPSWIDVAALQRFAATHDRRELRHQHGWRDDEVVIANIGTVCERKGQHVFLRAIALLQQTLATRGQTRPALRFLMVGARPDPYLDALQQETALRGLDGVEFVPETAFPQIYYHLSDIFVCSSFEESFPRVLMEAAAFSLPIVSTDVNGVAELFGPDDAWLVPSGDATRLAGAMREAVGAHLAGNRTRAERAHAIVAQRYDAARTLPLHAALAAETASRA
jgi:glycosyltransferase involved in cell wall biosynthesis